MNEYLAFIDVPWLQKKMIQAATVTKIITQNADGTYTYVNQYPIKTVTLTFKFNEAVENIGLDNKKRAVPPFFVDSFLKSVFNAIFLDNL